MQWKERQLWLTVGVWKESWLERAVQVPLPGPLQDQQSTIWHWKARDGALEVLSALRRREIGLLSSCQVFGRVRRHLTKTRMNVVKTFNKFDRDGGGSLGQDELREFLSALEVELDREEFDTMVKMIDEDGGGEIELQEFIDALKKFGDMGEAMQTRKKASCDIADGLGRTPLHWAAENGHWQVVQFLVDYMGADREWRDDQGQTALLVASAAGECEMVRFLVDDMRVSVSVKNNAGWGALHLAAQGGHLGAVKHLIRAGAHPSRLVSGVDASEAVNCGWTALHLASFGGHNDVVRFLVEGCNVALDGETEDRSRAVHLASYKGHLSVVEFLVQAGADLALRDQAGATALHLAAMKGHLAVVELLVVVGGMPVDGQTQAGATPLYLACKAGHTKCVRWLTDNEVQVSNAEAEAANKRGISLVPKDEAWFQSEKQIY